MSIHYNKTTILVEILGNDKYTLNSILTLFETYSNDLAA